MRLRRPVALTLCAVEGGLGLGLIVTAGGIGAWRAATLHPARRRPALPRRHQRADRAAERCARTSAAAASATSARRRSAAGRSPGPPCWRRPRCRPSTCARSARRRPRGAASSCWHSCCAELLVIGALSPEVGEGLIRLGYSEPCELRDVPVERTLAALQRSKQWRRYAGLIASDELRPMSGASCAGATWSTRAATRSGRPTWCSRCSCSTAARPFTPRWSTPAPACRCPGRPRQPDSLASPPAAPGELPQPELPGRARRACRSCRVPRI